MEHSEFPWGVEHAPGLLTPLGVAGWIVAAVLALVLMNALRNGGGGGEGRRKGGDAHIHETYAVILAAARYALRQDEFGILRGADVLRRVVKTHLGGVLLAGGGLGKHLKKLGEAMGEGDDKKPDDKKKKKDDPHGGKGGHGDRHEPRHVAAEPASSTTVAETVHGHSMTLNIGADVLEKPVSDGHGGHRPGHDHDHDHHDEDEDKPLTLEQQLLLVRKSVREFEAWWSDKPSRMAELRAAHDDLTTPKKSDAAIAALLEERK